MRGRGRKVFHLSHHCWRYFHILKLTLFCSTLFPGKKQASCLDLFVLMISMKRLLPRLWHDCQNTHLNARLLKRLLIFPGGKESALKNPSVHTQVNPDYFLSFSSFSSPFPFPPPPVSPPFFFKKKSKTQVKARSLCATIF